MKGTKQNAKKLEITSLLKQTVAKLAEENRLSMVVLFGSQSTGNVHEESDVDIAYQTETRLSGEQEVSLNYQFAQIFGTDRIDTVNITHAPPLLTREILDSATTLYDKTGIAFPTFELHALRNFLEAKPLFDIRREKLGIFANAG